MTRWTVEISEGAADAIVRLDKPARTRIRRFLRERIAGAEDPRRIGTALKGGRLWRYRVGDYRLICAIEDDKARVLTLTVGHRREVYRGGV